MSATLAAMDRARKARERGEYVQALRLHQAIHDAPLPAPDDRPKINLRHFSLFEWNLLALEFPPARLAMQGLRDREAARQEADTEQRFLYLIELNRYLSDSRSTLALFRELETRAPGIAKRVFHYAADVLLDCGAADVLQRYLPEPNEGMRYRAQYLNDVIRECSIPRRLGETLAFVSELRLQCGLLKLLGKPADGEALRTTALGLIEPDDTRELALREVRAPGTIAQLMSDWRDAQDAQH